MTNNSFKRKLIASVVASSALVGLSGGAHAQQGGEPMLEEIVVTGIRASLTRSMDIKRDASGIVDAISAEDIGKFPDTNLAESLQRITGVSIDRRDGEGSKVTVRGLGPDFNLVTLNGRQMPGASIDATSASGSRSFDFANIASESVTGVVVSKTSSADTPPGGMGATIDVQTPRPLELDSRVSVGVKGVFDDSSVDSELTPEISGIYTDTFADGMFGVAVTGSYQERKGGSATAQIGTGWISYEGTGTGVDFENGNNHMNRPADNDIYSVPQQIGYAFSEFERERTNGQVTLQFAPNEDLTTTLDYTYSENEIASTYSDVGGWFSFGGQSTVFTDHESPAVQTPLLYSENHANPADLPFGVGEQAALYENDSVGLNVEWSPMDKLTLALDYHSSTAEAKPGNEYGNSAGIAVSAFVRDRTTANLKGEMPVMVLDVLDGAGGTALRTEDLQVSGSFFRASQMKHDIDQLQVDGEWEFSEALRLQFGAASTESDYVSAFSVVQRDTWGGLGEPGNMPDEFFSRDTILDRFDGNYGNTSAEEMEYLGGTNTMPLNERFVFDFEDVRNYAAENFDDGKTCADGDSLYCAAAPDQFNEIYEDSTSVYAQLSWDTYIAEMPFGLTAGVRHESTEVSTPATSQAYSPIEWIAANELTMPRDGEPTSITDSGEYDYLLPSLDMSLEVTPDVILRASYGQSIARPGWLQLRGGTSYAQLVRPENGNADRGTPGLDPYKSDNFDLSVEWYYGESSYASLGYFRKEVENFIGSQVLEDQTPLDNVPHPALGPRAEAAREAGAEGNYEIRAYILENYPDPETAYVDEFGSTIIVGIPGEDPNSPFDINTVANSDESVDIDGFEAAVQHTFGDTGFGVIANYTYVDASTRFENLVLSEPQFAITGVSDTANLIGFYEKDGWQARIAYNWRDDFLASPASGTGNNPIYTDEYSQVDVNVSYDINDNLSVFLEGLNLTEESGRNYGRATEHTLGFYQGYARYNIGARYTF